VSHPRWRHVAGAAALLIAGCATTAPDDARYVAMAKARQVPVLIYATSWNDPREIMLPTRMSVSLAVTGEQAIHAITLELAPCGLIGSMGESKPLVLGGPFYPDTAYVVRPSWPIDYRSASSRHDAEDAANQTTHMVIQSIEVDGADGQLQVFEGNDLKPLLTDTISNYCAGHP
jgi:hypothetical protein